MIPGKTHTHRPAHLAEGAPVAIGIAWMDRLLGKIFVILTLLFVSFAFYLQANAIGILYNYKRNTDEIECMYFAGAHLYKITHHKSIRGCAIWQEVY
ncbi:MAG: hypothetical protein B7Z15_07295 [Rhizobiales bacterium 32-66-8]|nr:MAG: hypothetical protein B7Z15_07295 [Rhizobiales bacterium 32-66-8]